MGRKIGLVSVPALCTSLQRFSTDAAIRSTASSAPKVLFSCSPASTKADLNFFGPCNSAPQATAQERRNLRDSIPRRGNISLLIVRRSPGSPVLLRIGCMRPVVLRFRRPLRSGTRRLVSFPSLLRHREGNTRLRPGGTAALCFGFAALRVLVPPTARAPSKKARLGTWEQPSPASVPAECPE